MVVSFYLDLLDIHFSFFIQTLNFFFFQTLSIFKGAFQRATKVASSVAPRVVGDLPKVEGDLISSVHDHRGGNGDKLASSPRRSVSLRLAGEATRESLGSWPAP